MLCDFHSSHITVMGLFLINFLKRINQCHFLHCLKASIYNVQLASIQERFQTNSEVFYSTLDSSSKSSIIGSRWVELQQSFSRQWTQAKVQQSPCFLQLQRWFLQSDIQEHLINFNNSAGAGGWSVWIGTYPASSVFQPHASGCMSMSWPFQIRIW